MANFKIKDGVAIIPEGTTKIEHDAFRDCPNLPASPSPTV